MLEHFFRDIRYALRGLRRSPGFTATVVLTLGLGIGANAAMFGVIDRLMFRPLPYLHDPGRVHRVYLVWDNRGKEVIQSGGYGYRQYLDLRENSSRFDAWAAIGNLTLAVGTGDASHEVRVGTVSASFWSFFDARPVMGRLFGGAEDSTPAGAAVVVLSYPFWQTEFGGRNVVGQTLQVANIQCTIIGVLPPGFVGVPDRVPPALYIPITTYAGNMGGPDDRLTYYTRYHWGWLYAMARRKPGVSEAAATADLSQAHFKSTQAANAVGDRQPPGWNNPRAIAGPIKVAAGPDAGLEAKTLLWVTGVAGIVLLIACANVANLMFARVLRRRREIAVRFALGVSRARLLLQSLTESLVLALLAGGAGLLIAQWGGAALRRLFVQEDRLAVLSDWRTLGVATAATLVAGVLAGFAPALLATRADLAGSLKAGAREGTMQRSRTRGALLVVQGALSVLLLIGAGLFVQSLKHVKGLRMGYDTEAVVLANRNLRGMDLSDSAKVMLGRRLLEAVQQLPGVEKAALVNSVPFWSTSSRNIQVGGIDSVERLGQFTYQSATPDYFAVMDTRILRGRAFTSEDRATSPKVAVVSEAMAAVLWPGKDALGQCFRIGGATMPCTTVIGIAENAVQRSLLSEKPYRYYTPLVQFEPVRPSYFLIKVRGRTSVMLEPIRKTLQALMPGQGYVTTRPLEEVIDGQRRSWQVGATMFVGFGVLALLVAAVGLYGVITYNVAQRTHELGVRIALGAQSSDVVRLVVGQGVRFALLGVGIGLGLALLVAKWIEPLLYRQPAKDPATYGFVALVLITVALAASAMPALRATRADPNAALRSE